MKTSRAALPLVLTLTLLGCGTKDAPTVEAGSPQSQDQTQDSGQAGGDQSTSDGGPADGSQSAPGSSSTGSNSTGSSSSDAGSGAPEPLTPSIPAIPAQAPPDLKTPPAAGKDNKLPATFAAASNCSGLPTGASGTAVGKDVQACLQDTLAAAGDYKSILRTENETDLFHVDAAGKQYLGHGAMKGSQFTFFITESGMKVKQGGPWKTGPKKGDQTHTSSLAIANVTFERAALGACLNWNVKTFSDGSHRLTCATVPVPAGKITLNKFEVETDKNWLLRQTHLDVTNDKVPAKQERTFFAYGVRNAMTVPKDGATTP